MPLKSASSSMVIGSDGINSPSTVGADGNPKIPEYEFHCCTDIVLASTFRMQASTTLGDSCNYISFEYYYFWKKILFTLTYF